MKKLALTALVLAACSSGGGTPPPGPPAPETKSYSLQSFSLQPGEELINCYYVPADGVERYISKFTTDMNAGSHHLVVFRINESITGPQPASGPTACSQLDIPGGLDGMLPGSQQLHSEMPLPDGVAMKLEKYHGLYFQSHYINATSGVIHTQVTYQLTTVDGSKVTDQAGMIFYSNGNLNIPVGMSTASETCKLPKDLKLLSATGHMHMHGLTFDASAGTQSLYHTNNWDEPNGNLFPAPGMPLAAGTPITWACAYNNTTAGTLQFGNSASKNEMCIFVALYYPAVNDATLFLCNH